MKTFFTPPQIAKMYGINANKVGDWIRSGELPAVNVAANAIGRPRWRVSLADLEVFQRRRSAVAPPLPTPRPRRQRSEVIQFF